jgi:hypothetical protein
MLKFNMMSINDNGPPLPPYPYPEENDGDGIYYPDEGDDQP